MRIHMKYGIDDKPGGLALPLYALQWWVVSLPSVLVMGSVVTRLHHAGLAEHILYMQKLMGLMGFVTVIQVFFGHRLPLVAGPASILLVALITSQASGIAAASTSIMLGGIFLAVLACSGLLAKLRSFFTPRIVAVILVLIALTLCPTILQLLLGRGQAPFAHMLFSLGALFLLVLCNRILPGAWKSLTVLFGITGGSLAYILLFGELAPPEQSRPAQLHFFISSLDFNPGIIASFLFSFLALIINELGSIESLGHMLRVDAMDKRITRGVAFQGLNNFLAGGLGVIGPVDYSSSAGIIAATGNASRYPLALAGLGLMFCALFPQFISLLARIPGPVMGVLLFYLMAAQLASGLRMLGEENSVTDFDSGLTVGLPLMIALLTAFAPESLLADLPPLLRPILGNGFIMGAIAALILEHILLKPGR